MYVLSDYYWQYTVLKTVIKKYCLINGLDDIGLTLKNSDKITEFEKDYSDKFSWA